MRIISTRINDGYLNKDYYKDYLNKKYLNDDYLNDDYLNDDYLNEEYLDEDYLNEDYRDEDYLDKNYRGEDYLNEENHDEDYLCKDYLNKDYRDEGKKLSFNYIAMHCLFDVKKCHGNSSSKGHIPLNALYIYIKLRDAGFFLFWLSLLVGSKENTQLVLDSTVERIIPRYSKVVLSCTCKLPHEVQEWLVLKSLVNPQFRHPL